MLSQRPEADALLDRDPLALVMGMVLDQQVPLEKAFSSPYVLTERLGHVPDAAEIAGLDEDTLVAIFSKPPALHRVTSAPRAPTSRSPTSATPTRWPASATTRSSSRPLPEPTLSAAGRPGG